jgi:hypothetical protein
MSDLRREIEEIIDQPIREYNMERLNIYQLEDKLATALEKLFEKRTDALTMTCEGCRYKTEEDPSEAYVQHLIEQRIEPLRMVWEKYKHMDKLFSDVKIKQGETNPFILTMFDLWQTIKSVVEGGENCGNS